MHKGTWWAADHEVSKSRTWLSTIQEQVTRVLGSSTGVWGIKPKKLLHLFRHVEVWESTSSVLWCMLPLASPQVVTLSSVVCSLTPLSGGLPTATSCGDSLTPESLCGGKGMGWGKRLLFHLLRKNPRTSISPCRRAGGRPCLNAQNTKHFPSQELGFDGKEGLSAANSQKIGKHLTILASVWNRLPRGWCQVGSTPARWEPQWWLVRKHKEEEETMDLGPGNSSLKLGSLTCFQGAS